MRHNVARVILSAAILLLVGPLHALTLQDLRNRSRELTLDTGPRVRFSTGTIDAYLNQGQRIAVTDSKPIRKSLAFNSLVGTTYYALPSDFMQVERLTYQYLELPEITPIALSNKAGRKWEIVQAFPTHYFIDFATRTKVGLYPVPGAGSTDTVRIEYYAQATDMSGASDQPFNAIAELRPYHFMLAFYAAYRMAAIDGRSDLAALYRTEFYEGITRLRREGINRPSYRPGAHPAIRSTRIGP